jgi:predicted nuclease of predicted toxin-antitoxin system
MKILLDECVTKKLKTLLAGHTVFTIGQMDWKGLKNGILIKQAVQNNFDILLTIDKNICYQQNTAKYNIAIVVLNANNSNIETLQEYMPSFNKQINKFEKGKLYIIEK